MDWGEHVQSAGHASTPQMYILINLPLTSLLSNRLNESWRHVTEEASCANKHLFVLKNLEKNILFDSRII